MLSTRILMTVVAVGLTAPVFANAQGASELQSCLMGEVASAPDNATIGELRQRCETRLGMVDQGPGALDADNAVAERFEEEEEVVGKGFALTAHYPNYIVFSHNSKPNQDPFSLGLGLEPIDKEEEKFQVSFKAPVWRNMFDTNTDLFFAYTATSYWQRSNSDISEAFRETNYQPELFVRQLGGPEILGTQVTGWSLGAVHESNGRGELLSRSWNRIEARTGLSVTEDLTFFVRAWARISEDDDDDDNPKMHRYRGYGDVRAIWAPNKNTFTAMVRPGTEEVGYELTWSYPLSDIFRVYAQYYNGYGESLIDYDARVERIGIGFALNDYLQR